MITPIMSNGNGTASTMKNGHACSTCGKNFEKPRGLEVHIARMHSKNASTGQPSPMINRIRDIMENNPALDRDSLLKELNASSNGENIGFHHKSKRNKTRKVKAVRHHQDESEEISQDALLLNIKMLEDRCRRMMGAINALIG